MRKDLISKAELFNALCHAQTKDDVYQIINDAPVIEPEKGHWIEQSIGYMHHFICDRCGFMEQYAPSFCSGCGA